MQLFFPTIAAQFDFISGVLGVVVAVIASFAVITLIASYYRFQGIVQLAEEKNPEEMGALPTDILRVQLARFLAGCSRRNTSFSLSLLRIDDPDVLVRMHSPAVEAVKESSRSGDIICVFDDETVALLAETEPEDSVAMLSRISSSAADLCVGQELDQMRVGIASYPGHGLSGKDLTAVALEALDKTSSDKPVFMPEVIDVDEDDEDDEESKAVEEDVEAQEIPPEEEKPSGPEGEGSNQQEEDSEDSRGWKERRKNAMLDELTGVLKPSAVSAYMQRMMSELRRKKKPVSLFCIGVNNCDYIVRFHGEDAANDLLVGVSKILQDSLRADDLIGRHEKYAFLVLAQCSLEEAEVVGKRINAQVQQFEFRSGVTKLKTTITLGVAAYPEHGRNLHHLYTAGQKVLDHSRENDIRAYAVYDPEIHDKVPSKPMKSIKSIQA